MPYSPEIKEAMDLHLLPWEDVTSRKMFGGLCYLFQDRMFAFIMEEAVVTKLPSAEREKAMKRHGGSEFLSAQGRPFGEWTQFPVKKPAEVQAVMPWVKIGYDYVKSLPPTKRRSRRKTAGQTTERTRY